MATRTYEVPAEDREYDIDGTVTVTRYLIQEDLGFLLQEDGYKLEIVSKEGRTYNVSAESRTFEAS